jgi:hypothetical protein
MILEPVVNNNGIANKALVLTAPALRNFGIIARHKSFVVVALSCRIGRGSGGTTQALACSSSIVKGSVLAGRRQTNKFFANNH